MKRFFSLVLTLAMLVSMLTAFCVGSATTVSAATVIPKNSPAIATNVNTTVNLSNYSVTFDDGTVASNVVWKNNGTAITSYKPTAAGVTTLTATSGSKTKNIYVVAKATSASEYVLYQANLADFASIDALKTAGWSFASGGNYAKNSDGSLSLGVSDKWSIAYAYLPAWLADFGNYGITADVKLTSVYEGDNTRWFSILYHGAGVNGANDNYLQMTIRNDSDAANGVEFGERYSGAWNVVSTGAASVATMDNGYKTIKAEIYNGNVAQTVAGKQVIYSDAAAYNSKISHKSGKGYLGFTASGSTLAVKSVKVTLQTAIPEEDVTVSLIKNNNHRGENLVNPIANVQKISSVTADTLNGLSVAFFNASDVDVTTAMQACVTANVVPTIYITTNAQADSVVAAMNSTGNKDVNVVSNSASVLAYIRGKKAMVRCGLRIDMSSQMADGVLTPAEANAIRISVRNAPATFCVVDAAYVTRDAVAELQEFALAVWAVAANKSTGNKADFDVEVLKAITAGVNGVITDSATAVYNIIETHFQDSAFTRTPLIIGHRGNPSCAPENTIPSFQAAYDNGADIFEIDVDLTKDNVVVVLHDGTLDRTTTYEDGVPDKPNDSSTWGGTHINNMTWAEVQQYYVLANDGTSTGKPIPTLAEVLEWARGKDVKIYIEFKSSAASCITQTMNKIKELNMAHQVDIISFSSDALTLAQQGIPGMSTGYLLSNSIDATTYLKALQQIENLIQYAQNVKSTINIQSYGGQATRHSVQAVADRGMTIWPWTYNSSTTDKAFFSAADGITTDNVETIKDMVKSVYTEKATLVVGQTYIGGTLTAETYGNARYLAEPENIVASVISGDAVKVENGKLVAKKEGQSWVLLGYKTKTAAGTDYIVYGAPVLITVDNGNKNAAKNLFELGNIADVNSYSAADLASLRILQQKALDILSGAVSATDAEIIKLSADMAQLLGNTYSISSVPVSKYTAPAPNYYKWDSATQTDSTELNETYIDDGVRLADGKKGSTSTTSNRYSVWSKGITVEVVMDYGKTISAKQFKGYFASGQWGVLAPKNMKIFASSNNSSWTEVKGSLSTVVTVDGDWDLNEYTFMADTNVEARYIKFQIIPNSYFTWVDELETVQQIGDCVRGNYVYITDINSRVQSGNAVVYTSKSNPITVADENHAWTYNIIAKLDKDSGEYIITHSAAGTGASTPTVNLASDEIMIAVHNWESGITDYTAVKGSAQNSFNAATGTVGKVLKLHGINTETATLYAAPYITFENADESHTCSAKDDKWQSDKDGHWQECSCGGKVNAQTHDNGSWKVTTPAQVGVKGEKELRCTVCNYLLEKAEIPALEPEHTHSPENNSWQSNESKHWKECSCGDKLNEASHDNGRWETVTQPQIGIDGKKELRCTVCGYAMDEESIPALKEEAPDPEYVVGDINGNGKIDARDYLLLKRAYFGTYTLTCADEVADINGNGKIDARDYLLLKRAYFGTYEIK
ncbi:MAG: hypothetical protein IKU23_04180 [Clostridia bacterium]|nr:hypothetical protein [Clostridia bacterium]